MDGLELHGERSEAPVAGQTESWMLFKNLPVEMDTNICSHVLRTNLQHLEGNTGREERVLFEGLYLTTTTTNVCRCTLMH